MANRIGIESIEENNNRIIFKFFDSNRLDMDNLFKNLGYIIMNGCGINDYYKAAGHIGKSDVSIRSLS